MKQKLQSLLHTTGVFSYYYGYQYFIRSVELAVQNPERLQSIQKEIYITVASEYQTSVMMKNGGEQLLIQMTGSPGWADKIPYPRDLIAIFAQYLLRESGQNP